MNEDRVKGTYEQAKGTVKEKVGQATDDDKLKASGQADKLKGKFHEAVGNLKDALSGKDQRKH